MHDNSSNVTQASKALFCGTCHTRLSNWLQPITSDEQMLEFGDLESDFAKKRTDCPIPAGYVYSIEGRSLDPLTQTLCREKTEPCFSVSDVLDFIGLSDEPERVCGCCGLAGLGGPNRTCSCGKLIGTEFSDCCTWELFVPDQQTTYWKRKND